MPLSALSSGWTTTWSYKQRTPPTGLSSFMQILRRNGACCMTSRGRRTPRSSRRLQRQSSHTASPPRFVAPPSSLVSDHARGASYKNSPYIYNGRLLPGPPHAQHTAIPLYVPTSNAVLTFWKSVLMLRAPRERHGHRSSPRPARVSLPPGWCGDRSRQAAAARIGGPGLVSRAAPLGPPA